MHQPYCVARRHRGVSLIEIMVGVALGLVAALVVTNVFSASEKFRRNVTGSGDALQSATLAAMRLNLSVQEAGAGFVRGSHLWGCQVKATNGGTKILPRTDAYTAPFDSLPTTMNMLAAGIVSGGDSGSDILISMAADSPASNRDLLFTPGENKMVTSASLSISPSDFFLVVPQIVAGDVGDCQIVQVASGYATGTGASDTSLGAKVVTSSPATVDLNKDSYGDIASDIKLQSPSAFHLGAAPIFSAFAVNANGELVERDLLARRDDQVLAESVFLLKARYGVDDGVGGTANDNIVDEWVSPAEDGWKIADLMKKDSAVGQKINQIKAVRVALVVRSKRIGPTDVTRSKIELFPDLATARQFSYDLSSDDKGYEYQVYDWVIPLRNLKAVPKS
ncbi:PilW family protein [Niveibacterium sp. COAC-50]|uniref:PilW family protein n=1 Tax=Niveibacterium sp. COAC-50 TaxID=2729384 RepID=UPI001552CE92|nr:PilW family protein [Niveibacterium sp. COAC-50]